MLDDKHPFLRGNGFWLKAIESLGDLRGEQTTRRGKEKCGLDILESRTRAPREPTDQKANATPRGDSVHRNDFTCQR